MIDHVRLQLWCNGKQNLPSAFGAILSPVFWTTWEKGSVPWPDAETQRAEQPSAANGTLLVFEQLQTFVHDALQSIDGSR